MANEFTTPFDAYRAKLESALRMLCFGHEFRQQACEFEMLRVKRDFAAMRSTCEAALGAPEGRALLAAASFAKLNGSVQGEHHVG